MTSRPFRLALLVVLLALAPGSAHAATAKPELKAAAAIVVDADSGEVLFEKAADRPRALASTTKLMTALLVLERAEPNEVFRAADYDAAPVESQIGLRRGERMRVSDLLEALMLESANDAAVTLAEGVSGSRKAFVEEMNARAAELGLDDTRFTDPIGIGGDNRASARDLAELARVLLQNERFAALVDQPSAVLETGARRREVRNRNRLVLRHGFVNGVKTGHTRRAGYVLVGSATGRAKQIVSVVFGEPSEAARDAESLELLRYGIDQYRRVPVLRTGQEVRGADIRFFGDQVALVTAEDVALTVRKGERPRVVADAPDELEGPLPAGERVGTVSVVHGGEVLRRVPLVTASPVPGAGNVRRITSVLGVALTLLVVLAMVVAAMLVALRIRVLRRRQARA